MKDLHIRPEEKQTGIIIMVSEISNHLRNRYKIEELEVCGIETEAFFIYKFISSFINCKKIFQKYIFVSFSSNLDQTKAVILQLCILLSVLTMLLYSDQSFIKMINEPQKLFQMLIQTGLNKSSYSVNRNDTKYAHVL